MPARQPHGYGGQAVLEGVMIRGQDHVSIAVRRTDGSIAEKCEPINQMFNKRLRRVPIIRGILILVETLTLGMRALNYSANVGMESEGEEMTTGEMISSVSIALSFAIGLFFLVPVFVSRPLEGLLGSDVFSNVAEGLIRLTLVVGYIALISRMNNIKRVFMYHGAEHMTIHAHEHGDALNTENVRKYKTAHPRCGTAFLLTVMFVSIFAFVFISREPFWWLIASRIVLLPVIAAVSYEIIRMSGKYSTNPLMKLVAWPSLELQSFTTRQPDDDQIEIAIVAMNNALAADEGLLNKEASWDKS